nr:PREDICTED: 5'-nucleotidase domain-containing protein 3-like [Haliaeetus albicilla]
MIFNTARDILIEQFKYPEGLGKYDYIPGFAIRGLHYDVQKSLLMKIDAFHYVQLGTAYRSVSSENNFLNAYMCKGGLLNLSVCLWHLVFFFPEQSTVSSGLSCLHLLQMLTWHIIAGVIFLKHFKPSVGGKTWSFL